MCSLSYSWPRLLLTQAAVIHGAYQDGTQKCLPATRTTARCWLLKLELFDWGVLGNCSVHSTTMHVLMSKKSFWKHEIHLKVEYHTP
jgi:hypothetical protein